MYLQRVAGNRAIVSLLTPPRRAAAPPVVQRALAVQIRPGKDNRILAVEVVGRPEGYWSDTMGDHTTAFSVHVEGVRVQLRGKTVAEAVGLVHKIVEATLALPGCGLAKNLATVAPRYQAALDSMSAANLAAAASPGDALALQAYINAYLRFRELVPGSTVNTKMKSGLFGRGKGEAGNVAILAAYEASPGSNKDGLVLAIEKLFDVTGVGMMAVETDSDRTRSMAPGMDPSLTPEERAQLVWEQHLKSIAASFPKVYAAVKDDLKHTEILKQINRQLEADIAQDKRMAESEINQAIRAQSQFSLLSRKAQKGMKGAAFRFATERIQAVARAEQWIERGREQFAVLKKADRDTRVAFDADALTDRLPRTNAVSVIAPSTPGPRKYVKATRASGRADVAPVTTPAVLMDTGVKPVSDDKGKDKAPMEVEVKPPLSSTASKRKEAVDEPEDPRDPKKSKGDDDDVEEVEASLPAAAVLVGATARRSFAVQVRLNIDGTVGAIGPAGRPTSPFAGTMGAHTTSWIVHLDHVRAYLLGKTVPDAIAAVTAELLPDAEKMKSTMATSRKPTATHTGLLNEAANLLATLKGESGGKADALFLQEYVFALLSYINLIPGATLVKIDTRGHGEGKWRGILREYEKKLGGRDFGEDVSGEDIEVSDPADESAMVTDKGEEDEEEEPSSPPAASAVEVIPEVRTAIRRLFDSTPSSPAWKNHLRIVSRTYPFCFARSGYTLPVD